MIKKYIYELLNKTKYYSKRVVQEDLLTSNNKNIMKINYPNEYKIKLVESLIGTVKPFNENEIMKEKLKEQ